MHPRAQQARFDRRLVAEDVGHLQLDVVGDLRVPAAQFLGDDLGEARVVDERVRLAADVHAGAVVVGPHGRVIDGADDRHVMHDLGQLWQQLADVQARHAGRDGTVGPAGRRPRFGVPGF